MRGRMVAVLALASWNAGCVKYVAQPIDAEAAAVALRGRQLAGKVWTLDALVAEALRGHPDVALVRAQYETARAAIQTAGERPNPTIALSPQIVTPYVALIAGTYGVDFDWTFETVGKRSRRIEIAHANVRAAAARVIDTSWKVRVAVRKTLLDLYAAERRGKLLRDAIAQQEELLQSIEQRIAAGSEPRSATVQARLLLAQLRLQAADALKGAALARASLAEALGMGVEGLANANLSFAAFDRVPGGHTRHRREALTHRADILAALADYASSEAALRLEIAKQYPDLHLIPGYQLDAGENKWSLGIGLTLPILNQNRGPIAEAEAKRAEAAAKFNVVQAKVLADCDRAAAAYSAAVRKIATTDDMLAVQNRQITSEQRLVAAGEGDKVVLLSAQVERATVLTARLDALVELQAALGALEEATQSPLDQ